MKEPMQAHQPRCEANEVAEAAARRARGCSRKRGQSICAVRHRKCHVFLASQAAQRAARIGALLGRSHRHSQRAGQRTVVRGGGTAAAAVFLRRDLRTVEVNAVGIRRWRQLQPRKVKVITQKSATDHGMCAYHAQHAPAAVRYRCWTRLPPLRRTRALRQQPRGRPSRPAALIGRRDLPTPRSRSQQPPESEAGCPAARP